MVALYASVSGSDKVVVLGIGHSVAMVGAASVLLVLLRRRVGERVACLTSLARSAAGALAAGVVARLVSDAVDAEIASGKYRGTLHGIPWGAKDLLAVKEYRTTWGALPYKDQVIYDDARSVDLRTS